MYLTIYQNYSHIWRDSDTGVKKITETEMGEQDNKRIACQTKLSVKLSPDSVLAKVKVEEGRKHQDIEAEASNTNNSLNKLK